jgi:hypothetical protein
VFFGERGVVNHVAIHLGGQRILHASGCVRIESLDRRSPMFRADLAKRFIVARRVLSPTAPWAIVGTEPFAQVRRSASIRSGLPPLPRPLHGCARRVIG